MKDMVGSGLRDQDLLRTRDLMCSHLPARLDSFKEFDSGEMKVSTAFQSNFIWALIGFGT